MTASTTSKSQARRSVIGWQGLRFTLPPDWNVTGFSMDRENGYLKVDSPGTMFVQLKWTDPRVRRPATLAGWVAQLWRRSRRKGCEIPPPNLRSMLNNFLAEASKQSKKAKAAFDSRIRPECEEADGERIALHFSWTGSAQGQGKIWYCRTCGRVLIAQVVGQRRDPIADVAAEMFGSLRDHPLEGWSTWALYDLIAEIPADFTLKSQKLMSGRLRLEFERRGGERIVLERWGLANVVRKRFTLAEWMQTTYQTDAYRAGVTEATAHTHPAVRAAGRERGIIARLRAIREAIGTWSLATHYQACLWECPESNKIYMIQMWHNRHTQGLLEEIVSRCVCH